MRIFELFEQTIAPVAPGQPAPQLAPTGTLAQANTATQTTVPGQPVSQPMGQPAPVANPALQQGMQATMTDLDKIAAQIVGLKQKQQQMQQQMQKPTP
jgi:hypothetical protein